MGRWDPQRARRPRRGKAKRTSCGRFGGHEYAPRSTGVEAPRRPLYVVWG